MEKILDRAIIARLGELNDGGSPDIVLQLIGIFLEVTPKRIVDLRSAFATKDYEAIFQIAHSLKSGCASLGLLEMSKQAVEIESAARNQDHPLLTRWIGELYDGWSRASVELICVAEERKP